MIEIKPNNETIGPTVIRRKLKMSGLNSLVVEEPVINAKPKTIITKPMAINSMLILPRVKCLSFSIKLIVATTSQG